MINDSHDNTAAEKDLTLGSRVSSRSFLVSFEDRLGGSKWEWSSVPHDSCSFLSRNPTCFFHLDNKNDAETTNKSLVWISSTQKHYLILPGLLYASRNYWNLDDLKSARRLCVISSPSIKRVNPPQSMSTSISSAIKQYLYPSQKSHISCPLNPHQRRKIETLVSFTPAALRGKAVGLKLLGKFQQNSDESLKRKQCCHVLRAGRFLFWMNKQCLSTLGFKEP